MTETRLFNAVMKEAARKRGFLFQRLNRMFFLCFFLISTSLWSGTEEVCIRNFQKPLCGEFQILDGVIVKSPLSKEALSGKLGKKLTQIAFLGGENLYYLESEQPEEEALALEKLDDIVYAQPDVNQKRLRNGPVKPVARPERLDLEGLWQKSLGEGMTIAIIDDGFNLDHEDLREADLLFSYDATQRNLESGPKVSLDTHGTQVAGVIFAAHNGIGADGIAPKAALVAIRQPSNRTFETVLSFTVADKAGADIINCSWNSPHLLEPVYDVITHIAGKKAVVFAAGNEGRELVSLATEAGIEEVITVGADKRYSNYGALVDLRAPTDIYSTKADGAYGVFGGTSAAAPVVSGLLALYMSLGNTRDQALEIIKSILNDR